MKRKAYYQKKQKTTRQKPKTIIDELFPTYASSHMNFFGDSLVSGDPLKENAQEAPDSFPGYTNEK